MASSGTATATATDCAADHHRGEYTERQRADLDLVLAFNHRLAAADREQRRHHRHHRRARSRPAAVHVGGRGRRPDPRPAHQGRRGARQCAAAGRSEPRQGADPRREPQRGPPHRRAHGATTLVAWLEWQEGRGDRLVAELTHGRTARTTTVVVAGPEDLFRPTAAITSDGIPWLVFGRSVAAEVGVWATPVPRRPVERAASRSATPAAPRSTRRSSRTADGGLHVCWQGRVGDRFGVFARRWDGGAWEETVRVSDGRAGNVWDPTLAVVGDGIAYAWTGYADGSYAIALRHVDARGAAGPVRRLTGGTDYALHPSLAATADGRLWCAFDVITVHGPRRQRTHPAAAPAHRRRAGRRPGRHAGAGARACRPNCSRR